MGEWGLGQSYFGLTLTFRKYGCPVLIDLYVKRRIGRAPTAHPSFDMKGLWLSGRF